MISFFLLLTKNTLYSFTDVTEGKIIFLTITSILSMKLRILSLLTEVTQSKLELIGTHIFLRLVFSFFINKNRKKNSIASARLQLIILFETKFNN